MILSRSNFMYLIRWIAALLVVVSHLRSVMFEDYFLLQSKTYFISLFYLLTSLGHESVIVFFVLSGYLIGQTVIKQTINNQFNFVTYLINRISRLYAVLIAALLLTLIFDVIGSNLDKSGLYTKGIYIATLNHSVIERLTIGHFVSSFFMLQNIILPPFGSNGPLWSLNCEFWYYVLFPLFFVPCFSLYRKKETRSSVLYLILGVCLILVLPLSILKYSLLWIIGLIPIYFTIDKKVIGYISGLCFVLLLIASSLHKLPFNGLSADLIIAFPFIIWLCSFSKTTKNDVFYMQNEKMASFSYTVYLIHTPLLLVVITILHLFSNDGIKMQPSIYSLSLFTVVLLFIYLFSYILAIFTEFKTKNLKEFMVVLVQPNKVVKS